MRGRMVDRMPDLLPAPSGGALTAVLCGVAATTAMAALSIGLTASAVLGLSPLTSLVVILIVMASAAVAASWVSIKLVDRYQRAHQLSREHH